MTQKVQTLISIVVLYFHCGPMYNVLCYLFSVIIVFLETGCTAIMMLFQNTWKFQCYPSCLLHRCWQPECVWGEVDCHAHLRGHLPPHNLC